MDFEVVYKGKDRFKFRVVRGKNPFTPEGTVLHFALGDEVGFGKDDIVEQCTGLKDKNGNLIYEGDIVSNGYKTGVVKYGEFNCSCCDGVYGWYFDDADIRDVEFYEIIGNIHEQKD